MGNLQKIIFFFLSFIPFTFLLNFIHFNCMGDYCVGDKGESIAGG